MRPFRVGQVWKHRDGKLIAKVIQVSDDGWQGAVDIADEGGGIVDTLNMKAGAFHSSGQWNLEVSSP